MAKPGPLAGRYIQYWRLKGLVLFYISGGTKNKFGKINEYNDYCPVHMGIHRFDLEQVRQAQHLYGISVGKGKANGFIGRSQLVCGTKHGVDPVHLANFSAEQRWAERLAMDETLARQPERIPVATRIALLHEVVLTLDEAVVLPEPVRDRLAVRVLAYGAASAAIFMLIGGLLFGANIAGLLVFLSFAGSMVGLVITQIRATRAHRAEVLSLAGPPIRRLSLDPQTLEVELKKAKKRGAAIARSLKKMDLTRHGSPVFASI